MGDTTVLDTTVLGTDLDTMVIMVIMVTMGIMAIMDIMAMDMATDTGTDMAMAIMDSAIMAMAIMDSAIMDLGTTVIMDMGIIRNVHSMNNIYKSYLLRDIQPLMSINCLVIFHLMEKSIDYSFILCDR